MTNRRTGRCERCGGDAVIEVTPEEPGDSPRRFILTRYCRSGCSNVHEPVSADEMFERTGLAVNGWAT